MKLLTCGFKFADGARYIPFLKLFKKCSVGQDQCSFHGSGSVSYHACCKFAKHVSFKTVIAFVKSLEPRRREISLGTSVTDPCSKSEWRECGEVTFVLT